MVKHIFSFWNERLSIKLDRRGDSTLFELLVSESGKKGGPLELLPSERFLVPMFFRGSVPKQSRVTVSQIFYHSKNVL